ncbi:MAG: phage tail tape measure protein [Anaerolineae bacterium]|nr:phage tail tape measure protein [Anaerolineae bacterium]
MNRRLEEAEPDSNEYKQLATLMEDAGEEAKFLADVYQDLNQLVELNGELTEDQRRQLQLMTDELGDTHEFLRRTEDVLDDLNDGFDEFGREIRQASQQTANANDEFQQTKTELQQLEDAIKASEVAWRENNNTTIRLRGTYKRWREEGVQTWQQMEQLSAAIKEQQAREMGLINETRELIKQHDKLNGVVDDSSSKYHRLGLDLQNAEGWINGMNNGVVRQHKDMKLLKGALDDINASLTPAALLAGAAAGAFNMVVDVARNAVNAVVTFVQESIQAYEDFDQGVRQSITLVDGFSDSMKDNLRIQAREAGKEIGRLPEEYLPALYQALSLGVPEDNSIDAVKEASIAARAANAELTGTLVTGQSIVNAYGQDVYDLSRVYDLLFFAVKYGAVTIEDLNAGMSEITSVAGEANVSLEDVVSAVIVMTKQGDSFAESAGLMSNMLTQLQIESTAMGGAFKEASGVSFREFIANGGNLAQALQIIEQHAKDTNTSLAEMLGGASSFYRDQQAMRGALELTGKHMEEFIALSEQAADTSGLVAAANAEVADSLSLARANTEATTEAMKIQLGEALDPLVRKQLEWKIALAEGAAALLSVTNNDYGTQITTMIEADIEAIQTKEELRRTTLALAASYKESLFLGMYNVTGASDELETALKDLVASQIDLSGINVNTTSMYQDLYEQLKAVYGGAVTLENGYIKLNGQVVEHAGTLIGLAQQQQRQRTEQYQMILAQQRQEAAMNRTSDAIARQQSEAAAADQKFAEYRQQVENLHQVLEVLDGDTVRIELEGELTDIRFRNINAPEIQHGDEAAMPWAYEAMNATQAFFDENPLNLQGQMDRESYDRIIASVPELERELVARGMAIPLPVHMTEDPETFAEMERLTQRAALAGVGMFKDQALAARVLNGEMVDLGKYYEEVANHQALLTDYFKEATGPVSALFDAYQGLADAPAWGIEEAKNAVIAGNEAIAQSYRETAYEVYLAQNGVTQGTIDMGVAMGIFTETEGQARLEFANTQAAIEELIISQHNLRLTDDELVIATQLLIEGLVKTPGEAAKAAKGMDGLGASAISARDKVRDAHNALRNAEGNYSASFTTTHTTINKTYNKTYNEQVPGVGDSKAGANNKYTGGRLQANKPYIVGDGPGGQLTPYSELFIPDQSGYLLDASTTAALLGNSRTSQTTQTPVQSEGATYIFQITIEGDRNDLDHVTAAATSGVMQAAAQIGLLV